MGFAAKKEAQNAAVVADYQRDIKLKVYKCGKCALWHLSSKWGDGNDD